MFIFLQYELEVGTNNIKYIIKNTAILHFANNDDLFIHTCNKDASSVYNREHMVS